MAIGFIPPEVVDEVRRRTDIVELVSRYVVLKKRGRNFVGLCPFHNEATGSFTVSEEKEIFYCFGCHKGGNAINFLMEIEQLPFPDAVAKLAAAAGITLPEREMNPQERARYELRAAQYAIHTQAAQLFQTALNNSGGAVAQQYLVKRGISAAMIERFGLGYAPDGYEYLSAALTEQGFTTEQLAQSGLCGVSEKTGRLYDKFRNRVMYPICDYKGQVIAFGGRIMEQGEPKYLNSAQTLIFDKGRNLYALNLAGGEIRKQECAIIMEGYMDVIAAHQFGVTNAIASLGTAFTTEHASLLRRYTNQVILAYDGDGAGAKAAVRGMDILREQGFDLRVLVFPAGFDPDEFLRKEGKSGWDNFVEERSMGFLEYKLYTALQQQDITSISGKGRLVQQLIPDIVKCRNQVERESFITQLAQRVGVGVEAIYSDLQKYGYQQQRNTPKEKKKSEPIAAASVLSKNDKIAAALVFYMLHSAQIFDKVTESLSLNFTSRQSLQELLTLTQNLRESYDWNPSSLFSHITDEEVKGVLLQLLQKDIAREEMPALAEGCISALQIERLQQQVTDATAQLVAAVTKEQKSEILQEIVALQQEIRGLRQ